jgi:hypothetical protein
MPEGDGYELQIFANCRELIDEQDPANSGILQEGESWKNIREGLIGAATRLGPVSSGYPLLPMWGTVTGVKIQKDLVTRIDIAMLRSVASVDLDASAVKNSFKLNGANLYFAPDKGYIAYNEKLEGSYNETPYVPDNMTTTVNTTLAEADADNKLLSKLYLYENPHNTRDNSDKQRSRVIISGKFRKEQTTPWEEVADTYYPVDFIKHDAEQGDIYRQINRNWKYLFNIVEVTGPGYTTPEIASVNYPVNMGITVIEWNQVHEDIYIDGAYHISLARREAQLNKEANSTDDIAVHSNIPPAQLDMAFKSTTNGTQTTVTNGIKNDWFQVEKQLDDEGNLIALRFTALQAYNSSHSLDAIEVTFGSRVKFEISIEQINQSDNGWDDGGEETIEDL